MIGSTERVRELLADALERPAAERAVFLDGACGSDADLRREVESLVRAHDSAGGFLGDARPAPVIEGRAPSGPLAPGQTIGHYLVTGLVGEGGMGVVYAAKDKRLGRTVALKVLSARASADAAQRSRLEREARIIANLQHPNIAAIHSVEAAGDAPMLVLEFVPGKTLAERLAHGRIATDEAIRIAREIAMGLAAAHDAGVIHRDLKPANVKITPDGAVKILDFGVAKPMFASSHIGPVTTTPGTVIGTPAYMSPEQARGQTVDRRADVWALGSVLFEMLSGKRAFDGGTTADILAAVIGREPEWTSLPPGTPTAVTRLLRRCLEKDPARRLRDAGDAALLLDDPGTPEPGAERPRRRLLVPALGLVCVAAGVLGAVVWTRVLSVADGPSPVDRPRARLSVELPPSAMIPITISGELAFSPDGSTLVYCALEAGEVTLKRRSLEGYDTQSIEGTRNAQGAFFSPDGRWMVFADRTDGGMVRRLHVPDGLIEPLCRPPPLHHFGGCWLDDGSIVYSCAFASLKRLAAKGEEPRDLTRLDEAGGEWFHSQPEALPGGRTVVFTVEHREGNTSHVRLEAVDVATGQRRVVLENASGARFLPPDVIVYFSDERLLARRFDPERARVIGPPVVALSPIAGGEQTPARRFAVSRDGTLAYLPTLLPAHSTDLAWFSPGETEPVVAHEGNEHIRTLRLSPEGRRVALTRGIYDPDVYVVDLESGRETRITLGENRAFPVWTPDGLFIAYGSEWVKPNADIRLAAADRSSPPTVLFTGPPGQELNPSDFTRDGGKLLFAMGGSEIPAAIYTLEVAGGEAQGEPERLFPALNRSHLGARVSPDGGLIAYSSTEARSADDDYFEVYVQTWPALDPPRTRSGAIGGGDTRRIPVSRGGGYRPAWSGDGRRLFFMNRDRLYVSTITREPDLAASIPETVVYPYPESRFDVATRDNDRIIATRARGGLNRESRINVVVDWAAEVRAALDRAGSAGPP